MDISGSYVVSSRALVACDQDDKVDLGKLYDTFHPTLKVQFTATHSYAYESRVPEATKSIDSSSPVIRPHGLLD
jgi:hypothetical protein